MKSGRSLAAKCVRLGAVFGRHAVTSELSGHLRSAEHLARVTRCWFGRTCTDLGLVEGGPGILPGMSCAHVVPSSALDGTHLWWIREATRTSPVRETNTSPFDKSQS